MDPRTSPTTSTARTVAASRRTTPRRTRAARTALAGVALAGLLGSGMLTACGDDDAGASGSEPAAASTTHTSHAGPVVVKATDYAFEDLPETVPAGTRLELDNESAVELHELVAVRLPDGDTRPLPEVLADPALVESMPATVILAAPGEAPINAVGDGTLAEPGRYVLLCAIPTGIAPADYLAAVQAAGGGKPEIPNAAAPHLAHGMFAELTVEAA